MKSEGNTATLRTAWISIFVTLILIGAKLFGGLLSGSLALISLAAESALDLFSVLLTLFAVRIIAKPADSDHPYGHGKFDNLTSLFQSVLLLGISCWIFYEALDRLRHPFTISLTIDFLTFSILIGAFILDFWRSRKLSAVGKEERSQALQTDALHFFADSLSVIVVFVGLIFSKYLNLDGADSYAAMLVAGFVAMMSIRQGKQSLDELTDRFSHTEDYENIFSIIMSVKGINEIGKLRMRRSGPTLFIDGDIGINRVLPFASMKHILDEAKEKIIRAFPGAEANLLAHPVKLDHESTFETIKIITSEKGLLPHNIELSKDEHGAVTLDLHLEFPPESSFQEAHSTSEVIEENIKKQVPSISRIVLHLEEERPDYAMTIVHDITSQNADLVKEVINTAIIADPSVKDVQDIALLESDLFKERKLAFTIGLDKDLSLITSHEIVTSIERTLRKKYPELARIVIHSEPV